MFGSKTPAPPPPPPPPPNPPTYASTAMIGPGNTLTRMGGALGDSILTGPMGAIDQNRTTRKTLLGQ